ncbi:DDB1- and CUL4-associated factor 12 [Allomyces javanicus]|nr:DDB1- and CUL4-associated factor 12 [Allomyces javanicus]
MFKLHASGKPRAGSAPTAHHDPSPSSSSSSAAARAASPRDNVCMLLKHRESSPSPCRGGTRAMHDQPRSATPRAMSNLARTIAARLPGTLMERPLALTGFDKVFATQWINAHQIVVGTKCNRLLLLDTNSPRVLEIPFLALQDAPPLKVPPTPTFAHGPLCPIVDPLVFPPPNSDADTATAAPPTVAPTPPCVGIHSIAINPSRTRMAVGAGKPYEAAVYSLPTLEPECVLTGHSDLVFSLTWASDDVLLTASRDGTVGVWSMRATPARYLSSTGISAVLDQHTDRDLDAMHADSAVFDDWSPRPLPVRRPLGLRREHMSKVRAIAYDSHHARLATLGLDATVKLWDAARMAVTASTPLQYPHETVCLGHDPTRKLYSVGSQSHVTLVDARTARQVHHFPSCDDGWGVRSLAHHEHVVACGGGLGRLAFYDVRAMAYVPVDGSKVFWEAHGHGYLDKEDATYRTHFAGTRVKNAVYSVAYSEDAAQLCTGGGPLMLGLKGCAVAVWS